MQKITEQAKAKINLTLHVLGRREDGYHELSSVVAFADSADHLAVCEAVDNSLEITGPFGSGLSGHDNIIWKAWNHLATFMAVPKVHVHLTKNLPLASGIGGGSADAAALVRAVLRLMDVQLTADQVRDLAKIGADVPVCLRSTACVMSGVGEKLSDLNQLKIPPAIVLVNPLLPCSTAKVFAEMGLSPGQTFPQSQFFWRNDMTEAALKVQPAIAEVLNALKQTPLHSVTMSGSGATCFGLAHSPEQAEAAALMFQAKHPDWWVQAGALT